MTDRSRDTFDHTDRWIAEAVRLHEREHGRLDDRQEVERLRSTGHHGESAILRRARNLAAVTGLDEAVDQWRAVLRWGWLAMAVLALVSGAAAALGVLGDSQRPVNIIWTLLALLGLNALMLILWLVGLGQRGAAGGGALGRLWLMAGRFGAPARRVTAAQAMLSLGRRFDWHRWLLSVTTHGFWALYTLAALLALLVALSLRAYDFVWETTILSPQVFVRLVEMTGWLPGMLGFATPDEVMVRASELDAAAVGDEAQRRAWSSWLTGSLLVYGLLPRLVLWALSLLLLTWRRRRCRLDPARPEWAVLQARLSPDSQAGGVVDPDTRASDTSRLQSDPTASGPPVAVALELGTGIDWPVPDWSAQVEVLGPADDRSRRQSVEMQLRRRRPNRLLVAVDTRLSPDRGLLHSMAEWSACSATTGVWLLAHRQAGEGRQQSWRDALTDAGLSASRCFTAERSARDWLIGEAAHD